MKLKKQTLEFYPLHNEEQLLAELRSGSKAAFTQIYRHYSRRLYYNILTLVKDKNTAEELLQDVFTKIWRNKENINVKKDFSAYIFVTARNRVFDFFQQLTRDHELYSRIKSISSEHYSHVEEELSARENAELLRKAIAALPPQRRRVFELCKMQGLSYRQASEEMCVSLSTIKDHMATAFEAVRLYVSKYREVSVGILLYFLWKSS